jgi:tetratricopeptide (TPR) repeat protein
MAKPMLVTLPFALLLLDFWPLGRLTFKPRSNLLTLVREKIPLFVLAAASSVVTVLAQRTGGAIAGLLDIPPGVRAANAFVAYCAYIWKMFFPTNLTVLYPVRPTASEAWFGAAVVLAALSILAMVMAKRRPYAAVGWFWFAGMLVPVIGLVQVGNQSMADRYTYVPYIGLFTIVAFGVEEVLSSRVKQSVLLTFAGLVIAACVWISHTQVSYWKDSTELWRRQITVADLPFARVALGNSLENQGRQAEAVTHYEEALRLQSQYAEAHYALAKILMGLGKTDQVIRHYSEVLRLAREGKTLVRGDRLARTHYDLGLALAQKGNSQEAAAQFADAIRVNPGFPEAHHDLGVQYLMGGNASDAIKHFSEAIRLTPTYAVAYNSLGTALANQGRIDEAIQQVNEALRLNAGYADAHANLGILLATKGQSADAVAHLTKALEIAPNHPAAQAWLAKLSGSDAR